MVFNFNLLGLLILFVLIFIYYSKDVSLKHETNIFIGSMVDAYIIQLLYIATFVSIKASGATWFFSKLYLMSIILFCSLIFGYYFSIFINSKYSNKDSIIDKKINSIKYVLCFANIISFIAIFMLGIKLDDNVISGSSVIFTYGLWVVYTILDGGMLFWGRNNINKRNFKNLLTIFCINILMIILDFVFLKDNVIGFSSIITVLIMYLGVENVWIKENERLRLENVYSSKINLDKVKFLSNMSHEIRTPLNTIDGFSQVILESTDVSSIKEDVEDIRVASQELTEIIDGLIDIATIENGQLELMPENYNVKEMFDNVSSIANSRLKNKDVKFISSIDDDIPEVLFGDQVKLQQVLLNVINNSIKYTKKGKIELNASYVKSMFMCRLKITIKDTGVGIKKEELNSIFDEVYSKDINNNESYRLGLLVAKNILELMNGKIDIDSTYGEGTVVSIVVDQKIVTDNSAIKSTRKKTIKPFDSKGKRVLIVDDNKLNVKVAYKLLEPYNVEVKEVFSGQECLDLLDSDNEFDLILMDDLMPKMSGTETLNILRKIERVDGFSIPVVVLTANVLAGVKNKYLENGFDDYLAKPIDRYELDRVLKRFLKK